MSPVTGLAPFPTKQILPVYDIRVWFVTISISKKSGKSTFPQNVSTVWAKHIACFTKTHSLFRWNSQYISAKLIFTPWCATGQSKCIKNFSLLWLKSIKFYLYAKKYLHLQRFPFCSEVGNPRRTSPPCSCLILMNPRRYKLQTYELGHRLGSQYRATITADLYFGESVYHTLCFLTAWNLAVSKFSHGTRQR